jgi:hypothetical protein
MLIIPRYVFWLIALFFALMPVIIPANPGPINLFSTISFDSYVPYLGDILLIGITVCIIAFIDVAESLLALYGRTTFWGRLGFVTTIVMLCGIIADFYLFASWYSSLKSKGFSETVEALHATAPYLVAAVSLSLGCRTTYVFA